MSAVTESERARRRARRAVDAFASFVRREATGFVDRNARPQYQRAFRALLELEDLAGVDAGARLGRRLLALRWEAERRGLLSSADVTAAERAAVK